MRKWMVLALLQSAAGVAQVGLPMMRARNMIVQLSPVDASSAAKCLSEAFPLENSHSWARALSIDSNMLQYMTGYLEKQLGSPGPPSWGVPNSDSGFNAVIVSETQAWKEIDPSPLVVPPADYSPYGAIEGILAACEVELYKTIPIHMKPGRQWGYVSWLATSADFRQTGLAGGLVQHATQSLKKEGLAFAAAYCVSPAAARVFAAQGYVKCSEVRYRTFEFAGQKPFAILPDEISVMYQPLNL